MNDNRNLKILSQSSDKKRINGMNKVRKLEFFEIKKSLSKRTILYFSISEN